jgi:hypothetical protein
MQLAGLKKHLLAFLGRPGVTAHPLLCRYAVVPDSDGGNGIAAGFLVPEAATAKRRRM